MEVEIPDSEDEREQERVESVMSGRGAGSGDVEDERGDDPDETPASREEGERPMKKAKTASVKLRRCESRNKKLEV